MTKLDRLARSLPDARNIVAERTEAGVKLNIGGAFNDRSTGAGLAAVLASDFTAVTYDRRGRATAATARPTPSSARSRTSPQ